MEWLLITRRIASFSGDGSTLLAMEKDVGLLGIINNNQRGH